MDYEKKYKEANKKVAVRFGSNVAKEIFADLYEDGDEKIRKWLICTLKSLNNSPVQIDGAYEMMLPAINWLERQGEHKPAEWSEEDKCMLNNVIDTLKPLSQTTHSGYAINSMINWLKSLKDRVQPKQEWSEENENRVNRLIAYFEDKESFTAEDDIVYANWLKSLRPQNTWKPSKEQMGILWDVLCMLNHEHYKNAETVEVLFQDLKKLREE